MRQMIKWYDNKIWCLKYRKIKSDSTAVLLSSVGRWDGEKIFFIIHILFPFCWPKWPDSMNADRESQSADGVLKSSQRPFNASPRPQNKCLNMC